MDSVLNNITLLTSGNWELWKIKIKVIQMHFRAQQFIKNPVAATEEKLTWREREDLKLRKDRTLYNNISIYK